jgi:hypothetical protein
MTFGAGVGWTVTGATGAVEVTAGWTGVEVACRETAWCGGFGLAGACTTLGPGPGPSAIPKGVDGDASRRGINAPPATATTSSSPAITRSFRLMYSPSPADNLPKHYRQKGRQA